GYDVQHLVAYNEVVTAAPSRSSADFARCLHDKVVPSCEAVIRASAGSLFPTWTLPARGSLLTVALRLGGPDGYARLRAAAGQPIPAQLEAASGVPLDSILAEWHRAVVAARPTPVAASSASLMTAALWVCLCGGLALRSSRCH